MFYEIWNTFGIKLSVHGTIFQLTDNESSVCIGRW
jgi:hypothetical protein